MKRFAKGKLVLAAILAGALSSPAYAAHIGGYVGPSFLFNDGGNSTDFTGGLDAAFSMAPSVELGAFFSHTDSSGSAITLVGGELNFYPLVTHDFYVGGKFGNANQGGDNRLAYAPSAGVDFDVSADMTFGIDGNYFLYSNSSLTDLQVLASLKIWFF